MSLPVEELPRLLANLNLNTAIINNSFVPPSLSSYQQWPWNTQFSFDFSHSATQLFAGKNPVSFGNNFYDNGVFQGGIPKIALELDTLRTMHVTSLIKYALTEPGSRKLQDILKTKNPEITEVIFEKVMATSELENSYIFYLTNDQHGWYVFSKLVEACNEQQLKTIVIAVTCNPDMFIRNSLTQFGSCSVKKLIKVLKKSPLVDHVVAVLASQFYSVMTQKYGLYIVTECLDQLDEDKNRLLYTSAIECCLELATHKQGCISLNTIVEKIRGPLRIPLIDTICDHALFLAFDPSGNFVVQKVLAIENPFFTYKITENLRGKYASLSKQKSGSHLVEQCLNSIGMWIVLQDLINSNQVLSLAEDKYGNYVIQTALRVTKAIGSVVHSNLVGCINQYRHKLQYGYGRNVLNAIDGENILLPH